MSKLACIQNLKRVKIFCVSADIRGPALYPFTTENPFFGTKLLGLSIGRVSGVLKGIRLISVQFAVHH